MIRRHRLLCATGLAALTLLNLNLLAPRAVMAQGPTGSDKGIAHRVERLEAAITQLQAVNTQQQAQINKLSGDLAAEANARQQADQQLQAADAALSGRVDAVEFKTQDMSRLVDPNTGQETVRFSGVNVQVVDGTGDTDGPVNGVGNLIVGYNELKGVGGTNIRTGSHNLIVGSLNNHSSFGGFVAGIFNSISGQYASVSGGNVNTASGVVSSVSGGRGNTASGEYSSVSGGTGNHAANYSTSVSGGFERSATGFYDWVAGSLFQEF